MANTHIPATHLRFSSHWPIYWEGKQLPFKAMLGDLQLRIIDYQELKQLIFNGMCPKQLYVVCHLRSSAGCHCSDS